MNNDTERNRSRNEPIFSEAKRQWQSLEIEEVDVANTEVGSGTPGDGLDLGTS
jgi:hypothetical protein